MRQLLIIVLLFVCGTVFAQSDTVVLKNTMVAMDQAMLRKDSFYLKMVLHDDLKYGHSNGWIEKKQDVINDLRDGVLDYKRIDSYEPVFTFYGNIACVRTNPDITVVMDGKVLELKLHVLQVWVKTGNRWQLLSRQSTKI
ncbi:nuclear transport factor 2 family protein [Polluticoccus soli]|uniref:nuclear transport factor 2 family protein n=1 Tax=Polluticoccus soli TaxID=3034150 RepID=UPI0023E0A684|nr:nuclear transport factor 2 family protein [Flavipsychrobacter sp. JY13-12]